MKLLDIFVNKIRLTKQVPKPVGQSETFDEKPLIF